MSSHREPRIIRAERSSRRYQVVDKGPFSRGSPLSIDARGMLVSLLMYPDTWEIRPGALARELGIGRDKCYRLLTELGSHGYLTRERSRDEKGRLVWGDYTLYEHPGDAPAPLPENQDMDSSAPGREETLLCPLPENQEMGRRPLPDFQEMEKTAVSGIATPSRPFPEYPDTDFQDTHRIYREEKTNRENPPPPPPIPLPDLVPASPGGGGGVVNQETRQALTAAGVKSPQALRRLACQLTPDQVRRARRYLGESIGGGGLVAFLDDRLANPDEPWPDAPPHPRSAAPPPLPDAPPIDPARRAELVAAARATRQELRR